MKNLFVVLLAAGLLIAGSGSALSFPTVYEFNATDSPVYNPDFSLWYADYDGDGKFSLDELLSFSGITFGPPGYTYTLITAVPPNSRYSPLTDGDSADGWWEFQTTTGASMGANPSNWTYTQEPVHIKVSIDIKPGACPNPLKIKSKGVLSVAVLGTEDFDVMTIDPATIILSREGINNGDAPLRWSYTDVGTPFEGELCRCHDFAADGYMDLILKFNTKELVNVLELDEVLGDTLPFTLTGNLKEDYWGLPIKGEDCIRVLK